jgi:mRNA interferase MazF
VWDAELPGAGSHPVVILTRDVAIPHLSGIACAIVTSTIRGLPSEVQVGAESGLDHDSVVNCDNTYTLRRQRLTRQRRALGPELIRRLNTALSVAFGLDEP